MDKEECGTCKFWSSEDVSGDPIGKCRRFPPSTIDPTWSIQCTSEGDDAKYPESCAGWWVHPATYGDDWCGEFKPIDPAP